MDPGRQAGHMRVIIRELFETVILALLIFMALHTSVQNFRVQGPSMRPTLEAGEHVMVNKLVYLSFQAQDIARLVPFLDLGDERNMFPFHEPRRGEVVIFEFPEDVTRDFVKRIVAVSGETVEIKQGRVFVDGVEIDEPYLTRRDRGNYGPTTVPDGNYFVLGDNRPASHDSRHWGTVPTDKLVGRAWVSFWPLDRWHALLTFLRP